MAECFNVACPYCVGYQCRRTCTCDIRLEAGEYVKVKHGRWIERESGIEDKEAGFETVIVCSRCDFPAVTFYSEDCESRTQIRTVYCPNCGARMDEVVKE